MRKFSSLLLTAAVLTAACAQPALAQGWHDHDDIHRFHEHDFDHWRGGRWFNGFHDGRDGWWWIVDGSWYFYPAPVYPYPDPYTPPTVVVESAPAVAGTSYYYCSNPAGYYPYVPQCYAPWQRVVSQQAPAAQTVIVQQQPAPAAVMPAPAAPTADMRASDERKLNAFAAEFTKIDPAGEHAVAELKKLDKRVEAFRQSLYKRDYNAMDILKNSEDLQHRIAEEKAGIAGHKAEAAPAPNPAGPPPGTAVTFPPQ